MTRPTIRVNTFMEPSKTSSIDLITKIFIVCGLPFGIIRLPLLENVKKIFIYLSIAYAIVIIGLVFGYMYGIPHTKLIYIVVTTVSFQYIFLVFFNFISIRRVQLYYNELNTFDAESCELKIGRESIKNVVQMILSLIYMVIISAITRTLNGLSVLYIEFLPGAGLYTLELYYYGHLLSLLTPRLRLINHYMELSLSIKKPNAKEIEYFQNENNKSLLKMEKLMSLYHIIIKAYSYLYDAIKWQLLVNIVCTFIACLYFSYRTAFDMIRGNGSVFALLSFICQTIGLLFPLFAPCVQGDTLQSEVRRLRELLASRLYENKLGTFPSSATSGNVELYWLMYGMETFDLSIDKCSRGVARALLAWTETRDLSFSLLRMLDIDISLPFKFVGLLVTYLIILLQFEKVINP